jgi:penicillin amidase
MKPTKILKRIAIIFLTAVILLAAVVYFMLRQTLPTIDGEILTPGIQEEVVIRRNQWGVPQINTKTVGDMFFAIGYLHASDRLFQMDLTRRMATGRLSEIFGERTLDVDKYHKDLMIEESIQKLINEVPTHKVKILKRYCDGVNFFIRTQKLQPEFTLLNYKPRSWGLRDIASIYKQMEILLSGSGFELYNAKIIKALGKEKAEKFISGKYGKTIINEDEYHRIYKNLTIKTAFLQEIDLLEHSIGSNNWVISGKKTSSGFPILANDQHLPNLFPAFFYQIYAQGPGFEWSGGTLPGIPLLIFGRNKNIGWGFTNLGTDVIDYFILEINPENQNQYKLDGKWVNFTTLEKKIKIKNKEEVIHRVKLSRFGPVFEESGQFLARHSLMQYSSTTIDAFLEMNFSANLKEFLKAAKQFTSPAQNIVFADRQGNIGYFPSGLIPIRARGTGELPIKATKSADIWEGFVREEEKPLLINPEKGYIVTANNPVVPQYHTPIFSKTWDPYFRADRIDELIASRQKLSTEDNKNIQTDTFLKSAKFLITRIKNFTFDSNEANFVLNHLKKWDYRTNSGIAPILFYRFSTILSHNLFADHIKEKDLKNIISDKWIYRILDYPAGNSGSEELSFWADNVNTAEKESFEDTVKKSLIDVYHEYQKELKKKKMTWENQHTLTYKHPLGSVFFIKPFLNRGPYFMSGGRDCILIASFRRGKDFRINHLSAFRMILDFSDFSKSWFINSSGQSGHFMSSNYDDQIDFFVNLKYRKMEDFSQKPKELKLVPQIN